MNSYNSNAKRVIIKDWAEKNIAEVVSMYAEYNNLNFIIELENYEKYNTFQTLLEQIHKNNISVENCQFLIQADKTKFSQTEWQNFKNFNTELEKQGSCLAFKEITAVWSIDEVENANNKLSSTIEEIKNANLSPFEQLIKAFKTVTSRKYTEVDQENFMLSRSIFGILNSDKIVCVGYASWFEEVLKGLNSPNIICEKISSLVYKENSSEGHSSNVVYIKDEKYGIDGMFYLDACFSSAKFEGDDLDFTFCLVPIEDMKHLSKINFFPREESAFFSFFSNDDPKPAITEYYSQNANEMFLKYPLLEYQNLRKQFKDNLLDKSQQSIINANKKIQEIQTMIFEELDYNAQISSQEEQNLVELLNQRIARKISADDFNKQLKEILNSIKTNTSQNQNIHLGKTINNWSDTVLDQKRQSFTLLDDSIACKSDGRFVSNKMEIRFQQYFARAIKSKSTPIKAETYAKAYLNVLMSGGLNETDARNIVDKSLDKTITNTYENFKAPYCIGDFAIRSKKLYNFNRKNRREVNEYLKKRAQERKQRKLAMQENNKNQDDNQTQE